MQMDTFCLLETYLKWHSKNAAKTSMWEFIIFWMFFTLCLGKAHTFSFLRNY